MRRKPFLHCTPFLAGLLQPVCRPAFRALPAHSRSLPIRDHFLPGRIDFTMTLTAENIAFIAKLSRLALTPDEGERLRTHLNQFFDTVVGPMQQVDTTGLQPLAHPTDVMQEVALRLCDDVVSEPDQRERNQVSAPAVQDGLFLVPRVIE